jgi:E3 ubiquitin-protein ligase TRIP12
MHTSFIRLIAKLFFSLIIVSLLTLDHMSFKGVILLLSLCACGSPLASKTLLHGISCTLKYILSGSRLVVGITVSHPLTRPADQVNIAL